MHFIVFQTTGPMATGGNGSAQSLSCVVCFEEYQEIGDQVPKLLPCTHTACESCIKDLIRNKILVCPVCRMEHKAPNKEKSFSQNMYILDMIGRKQIHQRCEDHGKDLLLFCSDDPCQKPICLSCLKTDHKGHEWVEIEEREKEMLLKEARKIKIYLEAKVEKCLKVKVDLDKCVKELKQTKENLVTHIDKMIEETERQSKNISLKADAGVSAMKNNIQLLSNVEDNLIAAYELKAEAIQSNQETVRRIANENKNYLSDEGHFHFPILSANQRSTTQELLGHLTRAEMGSVYWEDPGPEYPERVLPRRMRSM